MSVHRLRNLCANPIDRQLAASALDWAARARRRERPTANTDPVGDTELTPLFPRLATPTENLDSAFSRHGLARARLEPSGRC